MEPPSYTLEFEKPLRDLARQIDELRQKSVETGADNSSEIKLAEKKIEKLQKETYSNMTPWQKVMMARHPKRPYALDYVGMICKGFQELHGDRQYNDDRALVGGTAFFDGKAVMIVAQQKGREAKERIVRNFGMPQPEEYRKALRIMKMNERRGMPNFSAIFMILRALRYPSGCGLPKLRTILSLASRPFCWATIMTALPSKKAVPPTRALSSLYCRSPWSSWKPLQIMPT